MSKTLIMIRHAHRDNSRQEVDNGLDDKGRAQAKNLRRFFLERFKAETFQQGLWLVSSPKARCRETLGPLGRELSRQIDVHPGLDEQSGREDEAALAQRVRAFLQEWKAARVKTTVLCSHGDWLPVAAGELLGSRIEFKKGSWLELEWESGVALLRWYVPGFKTFYS